MACSSVKKTLTTLCFVVFCSFLTWKGVPVKGQSLPTIDNCPSPLIIAENTPVGQKLFTLRGRVNEGVFPINNLTFTLESPSTAELVNLTQTVYVDGSDGPWQWACDVLLSGQLDRDFEPNTRTLSFGAEVTDKNKATFLCTINIGDVNDNAPSFQGLPFDIEVNETTAVGTVLRGGISASDPDTGTGGQVFLFPQFSDSTVQKVFNTTTYVQGNGQVMDILLATPLDYETRTFYTFNIKAQDGGSLSSTAVVRVRVTDAQDTPPVFLLDTYRAAIREHQPLGTPVITVSAVDGDRDPPNSILYSIVQGRTDYFAINSTTGSITSLLELDRDNATMMGTDGVFSLTVRATEADDVKPQYGNTTKEVEVVVVVEDINDHPPTFSQSSPYTAFVREDAPLGALIYFDGEGYISVSDADQGRNSHFNLTVERDGVPWAVLAATPAEVYSEGLVLLRILQAGAFKGLADTHISLQLVAREISTQEKRSSTADVILTVERLPEPPTTPPPTSDDSITAPDIVVFVIGFLVVFNVAATALIICFVRRQRQQWSEPPPPRQGLARKGSKYYVNGVEKESRRSSSGFQNGSAVSLRSESVLVEVDGKDRCDVVPLSAVGDLGDHTRVPGPPPPQSASQSDVSTVSGGGGGGGGDGGEDGDATDRKVLLSHEVSPASSGQSLSAPVPPAPPASPAAAAAVVAKSGATSHGTSRSLPETSTGSPAQDDLPNFSKARRHVSSPKNPALGFTAAGLTSSTHGPASQQVFTVSSGNAAVITTTPTTTAVSALSSPSSSTQSVSLEPVTRFSAKGPISLTTMSVPAGSQPASVPSSLSSSRSGVDDHSRAVSTHGAMGEILY